MAKQCLTQKCLIPLYCGVVPFRSEQSKKRGLKKEDAFGVYVNLVQHLLRKFPKQNFSEHKVKSLIHDFENSHLEYSPFDFSFDFTDDCFGVCVAYMSSQPVFCEYFNGCRFDYYVEKFHPEDLELPF